MAGARPAHRGGNEIMKRRTVLAGLGATTVALGSRLSQHPESAGAHHAQRRRAVQRRPRLHQGARQVRGADQAVLRQADQLQPAQELRARPREAVFRVHGAGQGGRLRHRLAGAHVDLLEGGALHRRAVPVPRSRSLEQGARRRRPEAGRRRDRPEGRGHADRLCRRRHAQHLHQQADGQPRRHQGPEGARAGRADLVAGPSRLPAWRRP